MAPGSLENPVIPLVSPVAGWLLERNCSTGITSDFVGSQWTLDDTEALRMPQAWSRPVLSSHQDAATPFGSRRRDQTWKFQGNIVNLARKCPKGLVKAYPDGE